MKTFEIPNKSPSPPFIKGAKIIIALGAESAGNFSVFHGNTPLIKGVGPLRKQSETRGIYFSEDFGDLLEEKNFNKFKKAVLNFLKKNKLKPDIILTDLHPEYRTTLWGKELSKKFKAKHIKVQHHHAHIFSAIGEKYLQANTYKLKANTIGIALDGTGYGLDGKIWGGEVFLVENRKSKIDIHSIGHLENQIMIGGDLAVREPARMLISILDKFSIFNFQFSNNLQFLNFQTKKEFIYNFVKKYYSKNQFELLYNQLEQNFNCQETSSTGRVLDAVSVLLGFAKNQRNYKHEPIMLLEQNSTLPYNNLKPRITSLYNKELRITNYELSTTYLFEYLLKNLHKDKKRLAATAQLYIAQGLYEITKNYKLKTKSCYLSGGLANNKIISSYLESKGAITNKKIPRGDSGISFGQIIYSLFNYFPF